MVGLCRYLRLLVLLATCGVARYVTNIKSAKFEYRWAVLRPAFCCLVQDFFGVVELLIWFRFLEDLLAMECVHVQAVILLEKCSVV